MNYPEFLKKHKIKIADLVEVESSKGEFTGIVLPAETNSKQLVLKLKSGYNAGIDFSNIKKIKVSGAGRDTGKAKINETKRNPALPTIAILHTGGTIASRIDYKTGGVFASFTAEDLLTLFPELAEIANYECELVANIMSEDMRFKHYSAIAKAVEKWVNRGVKGIIIGHGTDTLAYTSAALAFALENCPIPIILVGAQRSSDRGSSDASINLSCAANFIAKTDFSGVAICMHESTSDDSCAILPSTKTRKLHTSRRDAFKAINDSPIAKVQYGTEKIEFLKKNYPKKASGKFSVKNKFEEKIGIVRSHPNMHPDIFEFFRKAKYKGLVLEATGIGQAQTNIEENLPNYEELKKFIKEGGVVVLTSQCIFGRVHKDIYTNCRRLAEIGIIFGEDMITETAFIKLAWLLGNYKKAEAEKLITENLRGEISKCTGIDTFEVF